MAVLNLQVAASADDAYQLDGGTADTTSTGMTIGTGTAATSPDRATGFRFTNVTIPPGSTIATAYIKPMMNGARWGQSDGRWYGNNVDNAAAFTGGEVITSRALTTANVPWSENINRADATRYTWPAAGNWAAIIQEIIDRPGWASGNAIALIAIGDGASNFASDPVRSYNNAPGDAATLDITYDPPVAHARPTSDVSNAGSWTTDSGGSSNLYQAVDETTASDTDYIRSPTTPSAAMIELALGSVTDPAVSTGHQILFRARQDAAGPAYGLTVALYQGATQKASYSPSALTAAFADYSYTLSGGEADSITDYADLRLRITATETPAAPTYVGSGTAVYTATNGQTLAPLPPTRAVGDKLVCVMVYGATTDISDSVTNWTKLASGTEDNTAMRTEVWWRDATNNSTDNPTLPSFATTTVRGARIFAVRGAAAGAPTVARSNNAASTTVTFPAATATAATTLSVLAYGYEDDPSATTGNVSGFSAFDIDVSSLGNDMAIGMDATRTNSSSGSKAGGTCVVQTGTFAASVNTGLHFIFEPLVGTRAQVSYADFVVPLASGGGTTAVGDEVATAWHTRAAIGDTVQTDWNVASALTAVGDEVAAAWHTRAAVSDDAQLAWNVLTNSTVFASDTFTGSSAELSTHTSDSGHTWSQNGFSSGPASLDGSGSLTVPSAETLYTLSATPPSADYEASLDIRPTAAGSDGYAGLLIRANPTTTPWYFIHYDASSGNWILGKQGSAALGTYSQALTTGQTYTLRVVISGSTTTNIVVYVDGVQRINVNDSTSPHTAAGKVGIAGWGGARLFKVDNLTASAISAGSTAVGDEIATAWHTRTAVGKIAGSTGTGDLLGSPSFAVQDFAQAAALGPDGYTWAQGYALTVDQYSKIVSFVQRTGGNGHYWIWSNNGGADWTNSTEGDKVASIIRGSVAYDHINDRFHAVLVSQNRDAVYYRRYAPTRDGSNNITAITQVASVALTLASGANYEQPICLFMSDSIYGSNGAVLAAYTAQGGTTGAMRASLRVLSNTTADATAGNWESANGTNASALSGETLSAAATNIATKTTADAPGLAIARWRGSLTGDLAAFYAIKGDFAYYRRLPFNSGTGRWGTPATEQSVGDLVGAGGSAQQEEQLLSKPAEDENSGLMWIGFARWKDATAGETWSLRSVNTSDALGTTIDVYSVGGVFQPADYALTGDIAFDQQSDRLISAHVTTGAGTNDAVLTVYSGTTQVEQDTVFTAADVDIPIIWQDSRTGATRYGSGDGSLLMAWRDTDGYPTTAPPYRAWFGTVALLAAGVGNGIAWNVRAAVSDTAQLAYHVRAAISDDAILAYHVRTAVNDTAPLAWHVRTAVFDTAQAAWHVRSAVFDTAQLAFHIKAALGDEAQLAYNVRTAVFDAAQLAWHIRTLATDSVALAYHVRAALFDELQIAYHVIGAAGVVGDDFSTAYHVRAAVSDTAPLAWHVRTAVNGTAILAYHVRTPVSDTAQLAWHVRTAVFDSQAAAWHVRALVADQIAIGWNVLIIVGIVGDEVALAWAVRTSVGDTVDTAWVVRAIAGDSAALGWSSVAWVGNDAAFSFHTRALLTKLAELGWSVGAATTPFPFGSSVIQSEWNRPGAAAAWDTPDEVPPAWGRDKTGAKWG